MRTIDADAVIDEMSEKHRPNFHEDLKSYHMWIMWYWALKNAPTIDAVSVVHGKWIRDRYWSRGVGMGEDYGFFYKCSMCEYEVESGYIRCGFNFCPYCGADMRKGADDE